MVRCLLRRESALITIISTGFIYSVLLWRVQKKMTTIHAAEVESAISENNTFIAKNVSSAVAVNTRLKVHRRIMCKNPTDVRIKGKVNVAALNLSATAVFNKHSDVRPGGSWSPKECKSFQSVAVIVPFRAREFQLYIFLNHMHAFLKHQKLDYRIYLSEQLIPENLFNKAAMMNVAFKEARADRKWDCYIFHDVDLLPEHSLNLYHCRLDTPVHFAFLISKFYYKRLYKSIFGGVIGTTEEQFSKANGFSNGYWGWGGEDDDMRMRMWYVAGYKNYRRPPEKYGRYTSIWHKHISAGNRENRRRFSARASRTFSWYKSDGLSSLHYRVHRRVLRPLHTWLLASLDKSRMDRTRDALIRDLEKASPKSKEKVGKWGKIL